MSIEQQLTTQLDSEITALQHLLEALSKEKQALTDNRIEDIESATREKLVAIDKQKHTLLARLKLVQSYAPGNAENTGLQTIVADLGNNQLETTLQEIHQLSSQCQELNRVNGLLINHKQNHTEQALSILRQTETSPNLYSKQGSKPAAVTNFSRVLGKA